MGWVCDAEFAGVDANGEEAQKVVLGEVAVQEKARQARVGYQGEFEATVVTGASMPD